MTAPKTHPSLRLAPNVSDPSLYQAITGLDQDGQPLTLYAINERMLTVFLNGREVVTVMTVGDNARYLGLGFLLNQRMLEPGDTVHSVDYDPDDGTIMVRADLAGRADTGGKRRIHTSGCAVGTLFGGVMESLDDIRLDPAPRLRTTWLRGLGRAIDGLDSLHLKTGSIHRCVLCQEDRLLAYLEDVGRHNAIDALAGYMFLHGIDPKDKILYTTGRLTSEVVIKTVIMGVPILVSRGGFTALGVELAQKTDLTLIGRCRGRYFQALAGQHRLVFDAPPPREP
ncbi:MAG: formate dehydrogenase accessory sulfurtransferase FdhD [Solidesulfovibrio sp. DCME]|uniref:formate dehydrogenase accessory sulfurtransferase FdhD n=1 Tax=Solidesulfovibrio sp. DCME TaxID=3447380 RepID=UPI003D0F67B9